MFQAAIYKQRRAKLRTEVKSGIILLMGNNDVGMNYKDNTFRYRQDSNFLYFIGVSEPHLAAIIDVDAGKTTLYGNDPTLDDIVWIGPHASTAEKAGKSAIEQSAPMSQLHTDLVKAKSSKRIIHTLPLYRHDNIIQLNSMIGSSLTNQKAEASVDLIKAIVKIRSVKGAEEIKEMNRAVNISRAMHLAMKNGAKAGISESQLTGIVKGIAVSMGGDTAYPIILSVDGQILHNHSHSNILKPGQLVLGDFGAETDTFYAGDITRTWPVDDDFTTKQREVYDIVLKAEVDCMNACKPGVSYRDIHTGAAKIIAQGLKDLGLMKGDVDEAVAAGAHALFFPHGLGHQIGLDVHDMEDLGEDYVGYDDKYQRSSQFGTAFLRLGRELKEGFCLTVEPGIYFIQALLEKWEAEKHCAEFINYDKVKGYLDFGGIRIEDNILITKNGHELIGEPIVK